MGAQIASGLLALLAALLPVILKLLGEKTDRDDENLKKLAGALENSDPTGVAVAWADHDRELDRLGLRPLPQAEANVASRPVGRLPRLVPRGPVL
jgi:hypothetical protein